MLVYFGTFLEFFEFMLFVALFPVLCQIFSSHFSSEQLATLSYFLFWTGFIARPLGALVLSPIGDKKSRKKLLVISIVGMSLTTLFMGSIPLEYSPTLAIILIAILRLCQGFFTGIEFSAATIYVFENKNINNLSSKYHTILIMGMMATLGMSFAYCIAALCQLEITAFLNFWRAAFILTGFLSLWIGILRFTRLPDDYHNFSVLNTVSSQDFSFKKNISIFFLVGFSYGPFYYISTFLNTYTIMLQKTDAFSGLLFNAAICLFYTFIIFIIFKFSSALFYKKKYISFYHILFIVVLSPLSYIIFNTDSLSLSFLCQAILIFISQLIVSHINVNILNFFPSNFRVRRYSIIQTLAASTLGGAAPLICHWFVMYYDARSMAVIFPIVLTLLSFISYKVLENSFKENI